MRFPTAIAVAIAAAPALVAAKGSLGFALGDKNADGSCKATSDYMSDFDALASNSAARLVRGYAASDCNTAQQILPAAKAKGFQVILGVWPDTDSSFNADTGALKQYVPQFPDQVYAITVGSETLYRGNFTGEQLLQKINSVKTMFPTHKVGTADSWNKFADGTADPVIAGGVDLLLINAFSYWQAQTIQNATHTYMDDMMQAIGHIQSVANGAAVEIWNGETGWPTTGGTNYGAAMAGTSNAQTFYKTGVCGLLKWDVNVFYFEAFDEPWKPASVGDDGAAEDETHWGAFTASREPKFSLQC